VLFKTDGSSSRRQIGEPFKNAVPEMLICCLIVTLLVFSRFYLPTYSVSRARSKARAAVWDAMRPASRGTRRLAADRLSRAAAEGAPNGGEEGCVVEWFHEKGERAPLKNRGSSREVFLAGNEDDSGFPRFCGKMPQQFDACHLIHPNIKHGHLNFMSSEMLEKLLRLAEGKNGIAIRLEQASNRFSDRSIVIHQGNDAHPRAGAAALDGVGLGGIHCPTLAPGREETYETLV